MGMVKQQNLASTNTQFQRLLEVMKNNSTEKEKYISTKELEKLFTNVLYEVTILKIEVDIKNNMANLYLDRLYDYEEEKAIIKLKYLQNCKFLCKYFDDVDDYIANPNMCVDVFHSVEVINLNENQVLIWFNTSSGGSYCFVCETIEFIEY